MTTTMKHTKPIPAQRVHRNMRYTTKKRKRRTAKKVADDAVEEDPSLLSVPPSPKSGAASSSGGGQDRPTTSPYDNFWSHGSSHDDDDDVLASTICPLADTDGIHPSRRVLFAKDTNGVADKPQPVAIMAPPPSAPGHDQRNQHNSAQPPSQQPQSQHQARPNPNGTSVNGEPRPQPRHKNTEREQRSRQSNDASTPPVTAHGPMPSHIQVAKPYVFQQAIEGCLKDVGVSQQREDNLRLAGVQWIDNVRRALKLPVRTFDTAVIYYHKFRLVHSDGEYSFVDAAAASLFAACKIEDSLKKSRDILCAAHNLKLPNRTEHLSPDDSIFEHQSRTIIGLERLMLEASSFDFRNRHPQRLMIKLAKYYGLDRSSSVVKTAYTISLDLYRTFAPLKQCTATMAFACLELAGRLLSETDNYPGLQDIASGRDYDRWGISRVEVMEVLLDLLELYTHYRATTLVGPDILLDTFLEVRIPLNEELNERDFPRFTEYIDPVQIDRKADVGSYAATVNGMAAARTATNGIAGKKDKSPTSPQEKQNGTGIRQKAGERGKEGTVRFMLNPDREREETAIVAEYKQPAHRAGSDIVAGSADTRARR